MVLFVFFSLFCPRRGAVSTSWGSLLLIPRGMQQMLIDGKQSVLEVRFRCKLMFPDSEKILFWHTIHFPGFSFSIPFKGATLIINLVWWCPCLWSYAEGKSRVFFCSSKATRFSYIMVTEMVSAGLYSFVSRVTCILSFAYVPKQLGDKADSFSILQFALRMGSLCILRSFLLFLSSLV